MEQITTDLYEEIIRNAKTILWIAGIINATFIFCFFRLCGDVREIKNSLKEFKSDKKFEDPTKWQCPKCGFIDNPKGILRCKQCGFSLLGEQ